MNIPWIKLKDYVKTLDLKHDIDTELACAYKWIYSYINLGENTVKNCCKVSGRFVSNDDLNNYGTDVFMEHPYEKSRRSEMLQNIRHSDCDSCWKNEEKGIVSMRLPRSYYEFHKTRFDIDNELDSMPSIIEVSFGNTCDLKCVYCNDFFSSQWEAENRKFGVIKIKKDRDNIGLENKFFEWLEKTAYDSVTQYYVTGGEPLIQKEFYSFVELLLQLLSTKTNRFGIKPVLIVVSNGNTPTQFLDKWLELSQKLEPYISIQMDISMESYGKRAEFIRTNLDWNIFTENLKKIVEHSKDKDFTVRLAVTHNVLSITSYLEYLKYVHSLQIKYNVKIDIIKSNVLSEPEYLSPAMLSKDFEIYIDELISWIQNTVPHWQKQISIMQSIKQGFGSCSQKNKEDFISWMNRTKQRRNLDLLEYFSELKEWVKEIQKC